MSSIPKRTICFLLSWRLLTVPRRVEPPQEPRSLRESVLQAGPSVLMGGDKVLVLAARGTWLQAHKRMPSYVAKEQGIVFPVWKWMADFRITAKWEWEGFLDNNRNDLIEAFLSLLMNRWYWRSGWFSSSKDHLPFWADRVGPMTSTQSGTKRSKLHSTDGGAPSTSWLPLLLGHSLPKGLHLKTWGACQPPCGWLWIEISSLS